MPGVERLHQVVRCLRVQFTLHPGRMKSAQQHRGLEGVVVDGLALAPKQHAQALGQGFELGVKPAAEALGDAVDEQYALDLVHVNQAQAQAIQPGITQGHGRRRPLRSRQDVAQFFADVFHQLALKRAIEALTIAPQQLVGRTQVLPSAQAGAFIHQHHQALPHFGQRLRFVGRAVRQGLRNQCPRQGIGPLMALFGTGVGPDRGGLQRCAAVHACAALRWGRGFQLVNGT